jgi:hypothetical protein
MTPVLIKAVLLSVIVGLTAAVCLRAFGSRDMFTQEAALGLVLAGALAMPLLTPITQRLHFQSANSSIVHNANSMTLLQELQAMLQVRSGSGLLPTQLAAPNPPTNSLQADESSRPTTGSAPSQAPKGPGPSGSERVPGQGEPETHGF